ncbi:CKLF-like MARVEL transmembrane domain-containing protein 4 [Anticarsia gemmatalis]|uniref:CKLF-like MARVEL transmembrane domain-containing protein 4 n=1 Tax=Anticarsia gemmatalis TaxID=129554 RepID=UPI003F76612F
MSNFNSNQASPTERVRPEKIVRFDKSYIQSTPGYLKLAQIAFNIIGFICIKISWTWVSAIFYNILYWAAIIITGLLLLMYTFHIVEKYDKWPWHKFECLYCGIVALTYFGLSIFATTIGENVGYAVGFFGLCAILAYSFDAYLKFKGWQRGLPPQ